MPEDQGRLMDSRWIVFLGLAFGVVAISILRFMQFGDMEPRMDQASFVVWVQDLLESERFFPLAQDNLGFLQSLKADEDSGLNVILRRIYVAQEHLFLVLGVVWFSFWSLLFGVGLKAHIAVSIAMGALALGVLAWFPVMLSRTTGAKDLPPTVWAVVAIFLVGVGNAFLNLFSALGVHNAGLLSLALALVVTQKWLVEIRPDETLRQSIGAVVLVMLAQAAAFYSHYTTIFLLPMSTIVAIMLRYGLSRRVRFQTIIIYGGIGLIAATPCFGLVAIGGPTFETDQDFLSRMHWVLIREGHDLADIWVRAVRWVSWMADLMSPIGLVLGLAGCFALAFKVQAVLPLALVSVHFLVGLMVPGFNQYNRTGAYAVIVLCLGAGWSLAFAIEQICAIWRERRHLLVGLSGLGLVLAVGTHATYQWQRLADPGRIPSWHQVTLVQGEMRPFVSRLESLVPEGSIFLAWNYNMSHRIRTLSSRFRRDTRRLRPFQSLVREKDAGRLRSYVSERQLQFAAGQPIFMLIARHDASRVLGKTEAIFGPEGLNLRRSIEPQQVATLPWRWASTKAVDYDLYVIR
jgi:hypothetical protein